jgi:hypothetical protein
VRNLNLELLTKLPREDLKADQGLGELKESVVDVCTTVVANSQAATFVMKPTDCTLRYPTKDTQATTMFGVASSQVGFNGAVLQCIAMVLRVVGSVSVQLVGAGSGTAGLAGDRRDTIDQGEQLRDIVTIGTRSDDVQRDTVGVSDHVMLAAWPRPVASSSSAIHNCSLGSTRTCRATRWSKP